MEYGVRQDFTETLVQRLLGFLVRNMGLRGHGFWNMGVLKIGYPVRRSVEVALGTPTSRAAPRSG